MAKKIVLNNAPRDTAGQPSVITTSKIIFSVTRKKNI